MYLAHWAKKGDLAQLFLRYIARGAGAPHIGENNVKNTPVVPYVKNGGVRGYSVLSYNRDFNAGSGQQHAKIQRIIAEAARSRRSGFFLPISQSIKRTGSVSIR